MNAPVSAHEVQNKIVKPHSLLRFLTCGSVDDGKSTLIGRLLYECGAVFDDQLGALDRDSKKFGTQGDNLDFALLVDGLSAEREQGITIDVAYRYFATQKRSFIVADTPGHEQYTRNMATGASTADVAILLVDARKGVLTQTRRHAFIVSMLRVRHVVLAINKMDMVGFDQSVFDDIVREFTIAAKSLDLAAVTAIPVSARDGDNVARRSDRADWYLGPTLLEFLESVDASEAATASAGFVMPVQWVNRPDLDFRGFAGTLAAGSVRPGDVVRVAPRGQASKIARIVTHDGDLEEASAGQAVTLTLRDEIDVSRGDVLVGEGANPKHGLKFGAHLFWAVETPLVAGQRFLVKLGAFETQAQVQVLHHAIDVATYAPMPAQSLPMNAVGLVTLALDRPAVFADYAQDRDLGGFILIDRMTNETVAIGLVNDAALAKLAKLDAPARAPWRLALERRMGIAGTQARAKFLRRLAGDGAGAVFISGLVAWLAGSALAGLAAALLDIALRSFARRAGSYAQRQYDQRRDYNADGGGI
jgi:sulfate adenylyltransferase large subunit